MARYFQSGARTSFRSCTTVGKVRAIVALSFARLHPHLLSLCATLTRTHVQSPPSHAGFCALSFQCVFSFPGFFIYVPGARPGSIWDGNALVGSPLLTHLLPALPAGYYVICDGGYRALNNMLCPFKKPPHGSLTDKEEHFNFLHSLCRGVVEKSFGILKAKFRWMLRGVPMAETETYADHFLACCILHNMVLEHTMNLSYIDQKPLARATLAALAQAGDIDDDDRSSGSLWSWLLRKKPAQAANLDRYVRESAALSAAVGTGERSAVDAAAASAADDLGAEEAAAASLDTQAGKTLRDRVFGEANMAAWSSSADEERRKARRAAKMQARANAAPNAPCPPA